MESAVVAGLTPPPVVEPTMVTSSSTVVPPPPPFHNTTSTTAAAAAAAAGENTGRWTAEEHRLFLRGLELHGKGWKKIATLIQSRTVVQIRTHAQKYFQKLAKAHQLVGPHTSNNTIVTGADGQTMMMVNVVNNNNMNGSSTASSGGTTGGEGVTGFIVPLGPDGLPVVSMRTIAAGNGGGGGGGDAASTTATTLGMKRRHLHGSELTNTTKRRVIGNVVRSAVREGRNIKRQQIAEKKRKMNNNSSSSSGNSSDGCKDIISDSEEQSLSSSVTTTLPSVSELLHPFVTSDQAPGSSSSSSNATAGKGRKQLVNTATHGMLPMAALEDAVFRLLTPAGFPLSSTTTTTKPSPRGAKPAPDPSPTGVTDYMILPSWVDAKNPPSWYNDGADLDTLLDDADGLNWLSDTGDMNETYPPAVSEPAAFSVLSNTTATTTTTTAVKDNDNNMISTNNHHILQNHTTGATGQDPTGGVFHPSTDSLSFLVDPPDHTVDVSSSSLPLKTVQSSISLSYEAFAATKAVYDATTPTSSTAINAATASHYGKLAGNSSHESDANLLLFPDLEEMGDEQAFVSALLDEPSGYDGTMSFPKLNSEMQFHGDK